MKYFTEARQYWQQGELLKAVYLYKKIVKRSEFTQQQKDIAMYMIAYVYILQAKQLQNEMGMLGVDLNRPYRNYYYDAACCLAKIASSDFDPIRLDLPVMNQYDKNEMGEAYQQCRYEHRSVDELLQEAWNFSHKNYLRNLFTRLRVASHFFAHA